MIKQETVRKKIRKVEAYFEAVENGRYVPCSVSWVTSTIGWLWRYRHISRGEMERLAERVSEVISVYKPE